MANKRELKKTLNYVCGELLSETMLVGMLEKNVDNSNVDNLLAAIITSHHDFIRRISHPEPGMPQKKFYKKIIFI